MRHVDGAALGAAQGRLPEARADPPRKVQKTGMSMQGTTSLLLEVYHCSVGKQVINLVHFPPQNQSCYERKIC